MGLLFPTYIPITELLNLKMREHHGKEGRKIELEDLEICLRVFLLQLQGIFTNNTSNILLPK